jgi:PAS domain S-box-containing protein
MRAGQIESRRVGSDSLRASGVIAKFMVVIPGILLFGLVGPAIAEPTNTTNVTGKNVVVLSGGRGRASINQMEEALRSRVPWPVNFSIVDLDNPRFEESTYWDNMADALNASYGTKPDLVVALMDPSLRFATEYRDQMFKGVPIVFMSVSSLLADEKRWPGVTGVAVVPGIRETINLALRLQPTTKAFAVISDESPTGKDYMSAVRAEIGLHKDQVKEIDIVGPPSGQMLERIATLPADTVVLFHLFPHDSEQLAIGTFDVLAEATRHWPTYSIFPSLVLDRGGIGGAFTDPGPDAELAGQMGARVLLGERPDDIPIVHLGDFKIRVDWRQLQRWHISESALPPRTEVLYRQPTVWTLYKGYIVAGISLIMLEGALIVGLVWQRVRRRKMESELAITNERLRMAVEAGKSVGWDSDYQHGRTQWFGDLRTMFGLEEDHLISQVGDFAKCVHPDDRATFEQALQTARQSGTPYSAEFRIIRMDGEARWIAARGKFYMRPHGDVERMRGIATDITERKLAEEAFKGLSEELIRAQEEERRRIAREIHDDYQQRLAILCIEIDNLAAMPTKAGGMISQRLRGLWDQVSALSRDLHSLSHRLHSSKLDSLGLVSALSSLCNEFEEHHKISVSFSQEGVPRNFRGEAALALFRIAQEALQNVKKHSGATFADVRIALEDGEIHLSVSDPGLGFDQGPMALGRGIGLRSMEERMRTLGGRISVRSRPAEGTQIDAWVPCEDEKSRVEQSVLSSTGY